MKKNVSFETALKRLEEIVDEMENGGAELERSLAMYEEGIKLVNFCTAKLEEAKNKVEMLTKSGGVVKPEPYKDRSRA